MKDDGCDAALGLDAGCSDASELLLVLGCATASSAGCEAEGELLSGRLGGCEGGRRPSSKAGGGASCRRWRLHAHMPLLSASRPGWVCLSCGELVPDKQQTYNAHPCRDVSTADSDHALLSRLTIMTSKADPRTEFISTSVDK